MTKALPSTTEELLKVASEYTEALSSCLSPPKISHEEIGAIFRQITERWLSTADGTDPWDAQFFLDQLKEPLSGMEGIGYLLGNINGYWLSIAQELISTGKSDAELGLRVHTWGVHNQWEQQIEDYQKQHQISGLIQETFSFDPLHFTCETLRVHHTLLPLGGDSKRLSANAREIAAAFLRAAEGPGAEWIRYRETWRPDPDAESRLISRFERDSWTDLLTRAGSATSACISDGDWSGKNKNQKLLLELYSEEPSPENDEGFFTTWALVHPASSEPIPRLQSWTI